MNPLKTIPGTIISGFVAAVILAKKLSRSLPKMNNLEFQNISLTKARDLLLSRLMNGRIEI